MPTVIDSLVVLLGLDPTGFKKGSAETDEALKKTKENAVKHAKDIEAKARMATDGFRKMRNEVMGLVSLFVGGAGLKSFIERITTGDAATGRFAESMGMAVEQLSAWQGMAEKFGGSSDDMAGAFGNINKIAQELARFGSSAAITPLGQLLGPEGLARFIDPATKIVDKMRLLQRAVAGASNPQMASSWMQDAGFSQQTVTVMREIGSRLDDQLEKQRQANIITKQNADNAKELSAAWKDVADAITSAGRAILNSPIFNAVEALKETAKLISKWSNNPGSIASDAADWIKNLPSQTATGGWAEKALNWFREYGTPAPKKKPNERKASGVVTSSSATAPENDWRSDSQRGMDSEAVRIMQRELAAETDPAARASLEREIARMNGGLGISGRTYSGASRTLNGAASAPSGGGSRSEVAIGTINLPGVTNAQEFARALPGAIRANYSLATQANFGSR